jgi:hypothetical protein
MSRGKDHFDGWLMSVFIAYCYHCDESFIIPTVDRQEAETKLKGNGWGEQQDIWCCPGCKESDQ